jgi:hypothetical protein
MNTKQVADRLVEMCRKGQNMEAISELYASNVSSREMPGTPTEFVSGKQAVTQKSEGWLNNVQEYHRSEISDPIVAGNHFTVKMDFDVTFKDRRRQQMEEVCVFQVDNGQIVKEQFFYDMPS